MQDLNTKHRPFRSGLTATLRGRQLEVRWTLLGLLPTFPHIRTQENGCATSDKPLPLSEPPCAECSEHFRQSHNNGFCLESKAYTKCLTSTTGSHSHKHSVEGNPIPEVRTPSPGGVSDLLQFSHVVNCRNDVSGWRAGL